MLITAPSLYLSDSPPRPAPEVLRVLDITMFYTASSGGVRTYLDAKGPALSARGVSHALVIPDREDSIGREGDTRVYRLRSPAVPATPGYRLLISPQAIERIIQEERPHIIELGSPFLLPLLVRWATRGAPRPKVVGFYHSDIVRTYAVPGFELLGSRSRTAGIDMAHRYIRAVYGRCDATVAASPAVVGELEAIGVPRVHHVRLGVDLDLFHPRHRGGMLRKRLGLPPSARVGLFVGRLCPEKALDVVLDANGCLPEDRRPHLVLVGTGQLEGQYHARARNQNGLTVLPHETDRGRVATLMADADFYVASGPGETFGLAVAEAMASGLGVLGVDSGAVPDRLRNSGAGILYAEGDADGCARGMEHIARRVGPELRSAARRHAENHFGWDGTFDTLLDLYTRVAAGPSTTPSASPAPAGPSGRERPPSPRPPGHGSDGVWPR